MHRSSSTLTSELDRRAFLRGMSAFGGALMLPALQEQTKPDRQAFSSIPFWLRHTRHKSLR
jgi:hypothetical protein